MLRECKHHGLTEYFYEGTAKHLRCKKCRSAAVDKRRKKLKVMAVEYKGGKCELCGYDRCVAAMEFHHRDPSQKDFAISANGHTKSFEKIKKELDKCALLCANCHREVHAGFGG